MDTRIRRLRSVVGFIKNLRKNLDPIFEITKTGIYNTRAENGFRVHEALGPILEFNNTGT